MHENFKHTYECPPSRMRLGLRISPLIIQVCMVLTAFTAYLQLTERLKILDSNLELRQILLLLLLLLLTSTSSSSF